MSEATTVDSAVPERPPQPEPADWLNHLRRNPLIPLLVGGAALIAVVSVMLMWAGAPEYRVLFSNLGDADGGRIIAELEQLEVPYQFGSGGQRLMVPADQVHRLRLQLAQQGLPQAGNVGFEIMDDRPFGISQFTEQVNFQRGLEGELANSIESLGPVADARVHLSMARPSVFVRDHEPAKASVILTMHPGRSIDQAGAGAIAHLVSSSVPDLATDDVTVVDHAGRLLSRPDDESGGLDLTQMSYLHEVERSYQQRIENILSPILGGRNVRAQVTAVVDFTRREETSEHYTPNQDGSPAAVRSSQASATYTGNGDLARGVPGALTNTPPGVAASPVAAPEDEEAGADDDPPGEGADRYRRDDVINYEVDRNVVHTEHRSGRIERLSVGVAVNHRETIDADGEVVRAPLDAEELEQIRSLVSHAMGFSAARGDQLEVVSSAFTREAPEAARPWWEAPGVQQMVLSLARYLLVLVAAVVLYRVLIKPLLQRFHEQRPAVAAKPRARPALAVNGVAEEPEEEPEPPPPPPRRRRKALGYDDNLADLRETANQSPTMVSMIVTKWMNSND